MSSRKEAMTHSALGPGEIAQDPEGEGALPADTGFVRVCGREGFTYIGVYVCVIVCVCVLGAV